VKGHSDERRKLLDSHIAQFDQSYLMHLLKYNKSLKQRNALLKTWAKKGIGDASLIKGYDEILVQSGQLIYEKRQDFVKQLLADFSQSYKTLADKDEEVSLTYNSVLEKASMRDVIDENRNIDRKMQRTTQGIHRDDLTFEIKGHPLKKTGSQGQQKSYMIALKLAIYFFLKRQKERKPILLLDDIFDKLDGERMNQLLAIVSAEDFGQVFITDTHATRLSDRLEKMSTAFQQLEVSEGSIVKNA
jgi:DNA replication and repair protein RecF